MFVSLLQSQTFGREKLQPSSGQQEISGAHQQFISCRQQLVAKSLEEV